MTDGTRIYHDEEIAQALRACKGNLAAVARTLDVNRAYVSRRVNDSADLVALRQDLVEERIDRAEEVIDLALEQNDAPTARWVCNTLGRDRGYTQRQELADADGEPLGASAIAELASLIQRRAEAQEAGDA